MRLRQLAERHEEHAGLVCIGDRCPEVLRGQRGIVTEFADDGIVMGDGR